MDDLVPCPLCGGEKGYTLREGSTYRWWYVSCAACGDELGECHADRTHGDGPLPARWKHADDHWNAVGAHAQSLRAQLAERDRDAERLRAALVELVACKDLKDELTRLRSDPYYITQADIREAAYERRKPAAWDAARAAIDAAMGASSIKAEEPQNTKAYFAHEFEVWQDDVMVASASGPRDDALREAMHYAMVYGQDGPVRVFEVTRTAIDAAMALPNKLKPVV